MRFKGELVMKTEILNRQAISYVRKRGVNYCKLCGNICEFGLPHNENGKKVAYLYCNNHGKIAKVIL